MNLEVDPTKDYGKKDRHEMIGLCMCVWGMELTGQSGFAQRRAHS